MAYRSEVFDVLLECSYVAHDVQLLLNSLHSIQLQVKVHVGYKNYHPM